MTGKNIAQIETHTAPSPACGHWKMKLIFRLPDDVTKELLCHDCFDNEELALEAGKLKAAEVLEDVQKKTKAKIQLYDLTKVPISVEIH